MGLQLPLLRAVGWSLSARSSLKRLLALERRDEARARFQAAIEAADTTPGNRRHEVREWRKHAARRLGAV